MTLSLNSDNQLIFYSLLLVQRSLHIYICCLASSLFLSVICLSVFELSDCKIRRSIIAMDWVSWLQKNKKKIIVSIAGCYWWESMTLALIQQRYRMLNPKISKPWITTSNNVCLLRLKRLSKRFWNVCVPILIQKNSLHIFEFFTNIQNNAVKYLLLILICILIN